VLYELGKVEVHKRKRLPHWDAQHGIYFVTFNLFDALPLHVKEKIRQEADAQLAHIRTLRGDTTIAERQAIEEWLHAKIGDALDQTYGSCFMRDLRVAKIVADAIEYFDDDRYRLLAWCVMPNHVHVVLDRARQIHRVVHSWKSFTAKRANRLPCRVGSFWQDDYYDRCVRDQRELQRRIEYVSSNPSLAGLNDWPFVRVYSERLAEML